MYNPRSAIYPIAIRLAVYRALAEGIHNANIALLGNYMASIFAMASDNHGGATTVAEIAQPHDQSVLSNPHHA